MIDSDITMDLPEGTSAQNPEDYLVKRGRKDIEVTKFAVGDYVLLTYPNRPQTN